LQSRRLVPEAAPRLRYFRLTNHRIPHHLLRSREYSVWRCTSVLSSAFDGQRCVGPVSDPTALQRSLSMRPTLMPGHSETKFSCSIAYATTATCAASINDAMMRFSAHCSAIPQVPASASHSAPSWAWRPLPNASLDRRLCRNCRLGCACLAEHDDAKSFS
jgi:hypothetical protein